MRKTELSSSRNNPTGCYGSVLVLLLSLIGALSPHAAAQDIYLDVERGSTINQGTWKQLVEVCGEEIDECIRVRIREKDIGFVRTFANAFTASQKRNGLAIAAEYDGVEIAQVLKGNGAEIKVSASDFDFLGQEPADPSRVAVSECSLSMAMLLIAWGADPKSAAESGVVGGDPPMWTATWNALANAHIEKYAQECPKLLRYLIEEKKVHPDVYADRTGEWVSLLGLTLHEGGPPELVNLFMRNGAAVNHEDFESAPLYQALFRGGRRYVGALLKEGADPNQMAHGEKMWKLFQTHDAKDDPKTMQLLRKYGAR